MRSNNGVRLAVVLLVGLLLAVEGLACAAETAEASVAVASVAPLATLNRNALDKYTLFVKGDSVPLVGAYFTRRPNNLSLLKAAGCNTLVRAISLRNPELALAEALETCKAAQKAGLFVILEFRPYLARGDRFQALTDTLQKLPLALAPVLKGLLARPEIIAWALDYRELAAIAPTPAEFQAYLHTVYSSLDEVNKSWGTALTKFDTISIPDALNTGLPDLKPPGFAWLDCNLALERAHSERLLTCLAAFKRFDPLRPVLVDVPSDPYVELSVPPVFAGMLFSAFLPQADGKGAFSGAVLAAAKRANRFGAFPVYGTAGLRTSSLAPPKANLEQFVRQAALWGASGVLIAQQFLPQKSSEDAALKAACAEVERLGPCFVAPERAPAVVLHFPKYFPLPAFYRQFLEDDSGCFDQLAQHTPFAPPDLCSAQDVAEYVDLNDYGACFAPSLFEVSPEASDVLGDFVQRGGFLLADLGFGCAEAEGNIRSMPEPLRALCGLLSLPQELSGQGELRFLQPAPLFPDLRPGEVTYSALSGERFGDRWVFVLPGENTVKVAMWRSHRARGSGLPLYAGLFAHPTGKGWTLFATTSLWGRWKAEDLAWRKFHYPLLAPAARLQQLPGPEGSESLWTGDIALADFDHFIAYGCSESAPKYLDLEVKGFAGEIFEPGITQIVAGPGGLQTKLYHLPAKPAAVLFPLPLQVVPSGGNVWVQVTKLTPKQLEFELCGPGAQVLETQQGPALAGPCDKVEVSLTLKSGTYVIKPGSHHLLGLKSPDGTRRVLPLTADSSGTLRAFFSVKQAHAALLPVE